MLYIVKTEIKECYEKSSMQEQEQLLYQVLVLFFQFDHHFIEWNGLKICNRKFFIKKKFLV